MNKRKPYPMYLHPVPPTPPQSRPTTTPRRFSAAAALQISRDNAKSTNQPRFRCSNCNTLYTEEQGVWSRDTRQPFRPSELRCRCCVKDNDNLVRDK